MDMSFDKRLNEIKINIQKWNAFLSSDSEQIAAKQSYFLDSQKEVKQYLSDIHNIKLINNGEDPDIDLFCDKLMNTIQTVITNFKTECTKVDSNITEESTVTPITNETMIKAMQNNKTTQRMMNAMNGLEKQQEIITATPFTHMLIIDSNQIFIHADTKKELETYINQQVEANKTAKTFTLYEISFKELPLNIKTVISIG